MAIIKANNQTGYFLFAFALMILLILGSWQLMRGFEKARIVRASSTSSAQLLEINQVGESWDDLAYQYVALEGNWLPEKTFLMDNRIHNSQQGYEVLVPFVLNGDQSIVLVNRGWLPRSGMGELEFPAPNVTQWVKGQIYKPHKGFTLGATYTGQVQWPLSILYYDMDQLSAALGRRLNQYVLVLDPTEPQSLTKIWQPGNVTPARHYAYATQWWGLALTLIVFGFIWRRSAKSGVKDV